MAGITIMGSVHVPKTAGHCANAHILHTFERSTFGGIEGLMGVRVLMC